MNKYELIPEVQGTDITETVSDFIEFLIYEEDYAAPFGRGAADANGIVLISSHDLIKPSTVMAFFREVPKAVRFRVRPEGATDRARPSWHTYFMDMAHLVATRATCDRKHVGAVIVREKRVVATGYNGSPPGLPHCDDVGHDIVTQADGTENCVRTVHAEMNAILQAAQYGVSLAGTTLYTNTYPCWHCAKAILGARIATVVVDQDYNNDARVAEAFKASGVRLVTLAEVGRGGVCPSRCPRPSRTASSRRPTLKAHG